LGLDGTTTSVGLKSTVPANFKAIGEVTRHWLQWLAFVPERITSGLALTYACAGIVAAFPGRLKNKAALVPAAVRPFEQGRVMVCAVRSTLTGSATKIRWSSWREAGDAGCGAQDGDRDQLDDDFFLSQILCERTIDYVSSMPWQASVVRTPTMSRRHGSSMTSLPIPLRLSSTGDHVGSGNCGTVGGGAR